MPLSKKEYDKKYRILNRKKRKLQLQIWIRKNPEMISWKAMKQRCNNPKRKDYFYYGARGIKVLYKSYKEFIKDVGKRPKNCSIERINNDGNYEKGNCKWATRNEQLKNRRNTKGDFNAVL